MRRVRNIAAAGCTTLFLVFSCRGWLDGDYPFGQNRTFINNRPDSSLLHTPNREEDPREGSTPHCYYSAVEFPQGYNWKRDSAGGQVRCRLVLFKDGERILQLPVREDGPSADPDMHRIAGGHLYVDYCTQEETVLLRDEKELFRYPGRETLRGFFLSSDGKVHTLGQNRSGQGFSYRIDGNEIFARTSGYLFGSSGTGPGLRSGALSQDGEGRICFTFGTGGGHWWIWHDGSIREVPLAGAQTVYDLRPVRGSPVAAFKRDGLQIRKPDGTDGCPTRQEILSARIVPDGRGLEDFRIAVRQRLKNGNEVDFLYNAGGVECSFPEYGGAVEHVLLDGQDCYVAMDREGKVAAIRARDGTVETVEAGRYLLMSPSCIWMEEEDMYVALSGDPDYGAGPQIWHNGEMLSLLLCGYLTGVSYE